MKVVEGKPTDEIARHIAIIEANAYSRGAAAEAKRSQLLVEALEFYAEKSNWVSRSGKIGIGPIDTIDRGAADSEGHYAWAGGKLARRVLAQYREDRQKTEEGGKNG